MRILLVEDDASLGPWLREALEKSGYATDLCAEGTEAGALGGIEPYDLALLDLGLPGKPGLDVLREWRREGNRLPVIILTARDSWQEKVEGLKAGADDYIAKPFQIEELLARMDSVLKRSRGLAAGPLQQAGVSLDESTQSLVGPDGEVSELTATEFRLLRYFMLHPGRLLSKSQLADHIYEYDGDKDSNVIEVYVNRLRQKIGRDLIQTRRGQGYVFAPTPGSGDS
jgi:two-component system OmpR family response regulator